MAAAGRPAGPPGRHLSVNNKGNLVERAYEMHREGVPDSEISRLLGTSEVNVRSYVCRVRKRRGIIAPNKDRVRTAYLMRMQGYMWQSIANELGYYSKKTACGSVRKYAESRGLEWPVKPLDA